MVIARVVTTHQNLYHDNRCLIYHDKRNIAVFKFSRPHMVRPVLRSENWNFTLNREGRVSLSSVGYSKMATGARHEANLVNFVKESAEKDEIKLKMYVI